VTPCVKYFNELVISISIRQKCKFFCSTFTDFSNLLS